MNRFRLGSFGFPRRLVTRIVIGMMLIVIGAGLVTTLAINQLLAFHLRQELRNTGRAMVVALGESLANALLEGSLASIQEALDSAVRTNDDLVYAFAYGPHTPIVHTFTDGFPQALLGLLARETSARDTLLLTERGLVHDFVYRPVEGIPTAVHVGVSENRIQVEQKRVTQIVVGLTVVGCVVAAFMAYGFGRLAMAPLVELTRRIQRLGEGQLDERLALPLDDEVGELAVAFNAMADRIQTTIQRLKASEAGYRSLLSAAGEVGEGIALLSDTAEEEGRLLFVNETFARMLGFAPDALLGMNVSGLLAPESVPLATSIWRALQAEAVHSGLIELTLVGRQGARRIVESASTRITYLGRPAIVWFVRDITERKRREQELRLRNRELAALNAVALAMSEPFSPDMLQRGLHEALQALELQVGWVTLLDETGKAHIVAWEGGEFQSRSPRFPACRCGEVLQTATAAVVAIGEPCLLYRVGDASVQGWYHATVPLGRAETLLGTLNVAFPVGRTFDDDNLRLLAAIGRQMGVALENARLWETLRQKEQLRSELLARALHAQEGERKRIARELHDATGQSLNAILFGLKALEAALASNPAQAQVLVGRLKAAAGDTIRELQSIIYDLRPSVLDDLGLIPALRWYAETRLESEGVRLSWDIVGEERRLPADIETALFRIAQEAMTNIQKYAQAQQVWVRLGFGLTETSLEIGDDGVGFDPAEVLQNSYQDGRGLGLLGMRERAELLGGRFEIASAPGHGTHIRVTLPLPHPEGDTRHGQDPDSAGG